MPQRQKDVVTVLVAVGKAAKAEAETLEVAMSEDARKIAEHHSAALDAEKGGRRPGKPPSAKIGLRSLAWHGSLFEKSVRSQLRANQQLGVREELDYSADGEFTSVPSQLWKAFQVMTQACECN